MVYAYSKVRLKRQQHTRLTTIFLLVSLDMANTKPFVALACFCENVLEESDGVVSAIRIVDIYTIPPPPDNVQLAPDAIRGIILLKGLIALKAGDVKGPGTIHLIMQRVTGERTAISPEQGWPVEMLGGENGVNIRLQFPLGVKNFGLIWFDVLWGDDVLTRIPLMLRQGERPEQPTAPS